MCLRCATGYGVKASGRACWCAPGYYRAGANSCLPCGSNYYCPGARSSELSGEVRVHCGDNKVTTTQYARSDRECVVLPGYGWAAGNDSAICEQGLYNPGYNTRRCAPCPGGLTTAVTGVATPSACKAAPGYYYLRGKAIACAKGTYKSSFGNVDCDSCPDGFTTESGAVGKTNQTACSHVLPGYGAPLGLGALLGNSTSTASLCPANTYRAGEGLYDAAADASGLSCTPCPANMQTQATGSSSENSCLVPPGYGFSGTNVSAALCARGTYNPGWNREVCTACGEGTVTTDGEGSTHVGACKVLAGHGTTRTPEGALSAAACPIVTYGRPRDTYGLVDVECTKCMDFSTTVGNGSTSGSQCLTIPGYGWYNGAVLKCEFGYYSAGGTQDPCSYCGEGYNTTTGAGGTSAVEGADATEDCAIAAGWMPDSRSGIKPCIQGYYKSLLGNSSCVQCPSGTTTTATLAAGELSQCDVCRPGFGDYSVNATGSPSCTICPSGTYSFGFTHEGGSCVPCAKPAGYTGAMVSRRGNDNADFCVPEFPNDGADNDLAYDVIAMSEAALTVTADDSLTACQQACHVDAACQYYVFYDYKPTTQRCGLRNKVAYSTVNLNDTSKSYVLFEADKGTYIGYDAHPTDAASLGEPLSAYSTLTQAEQACSASEACAGIKFVHTEPSSPWKTFKGTKWEGATGKVRATGENINPWAAEPSTTLG